MCGKIVTLIVVGILLSACGQAPISQEMNKIESARHQELERLKALRDNPKLRDKELESLEVQEAKLQVELEELKNEMSSSMLATGWTKVSREGPAVFVRPKLASSKEPRWLSLEFATQKDGQSWELGEARYDKQANRWWTNQHQEWVPLPPELLQDQLLLLSKQKPPSKEP